MFGAVLSGLAVVGVIGELTGVVSRAWRSRSPLRTLTDSLFDTRRFSLAVSGSRRHAISVDPITAESLDSLAPVEGMSP